MEETKNPLVPLGRVIFECNLNGIVEVDVSTDGKHVIMDTNMDILPAALGKDESGNIRLEKSPVFSLFCTMMEAQKSKGKP